MWTSINEVVFIETRRVESCKLEIIACVCWCTTCNIDVVEVNVCGHVVESNLQTNELSSREIGHQLERVNAAPVRRDIERCANCGLC